MKNRYVYIWAAAAALFLRNKNVPRHYTWIADKLVEMGITRLAASGGETPRQTVKTILLTHFAFCSARTGRGEYHLSAPEEVRSLLKVQEALRVVDGYE